jgi:hypothetical protein
LRALFDNHRVCAAHQRCSRFSIKWPWPRWECDIAPSICSFRPNFDSHVRECWGVVSRAKQQAEGAP